MRLTRIVRDTLSLARYDDTFAGSEKAKFPTGTTTAQGHRRLAISLSLGCLLSAMLGVAQGEVVEDWVRIFDAEPYDYASALALGATGDLYVTGASGADYLTVKYDTKGSELWVRRYDHGLYDQASALAEDAAGNLYVTGYSSDAVTGGDYATVKYDAEGNELWVRRYDHGSFDAARALAVDIAGNVYVTGRSGDSLTGFDYATIKYDAEGNELWVRRCDLGGTSDARSLALDGTGGVYVTGGSGDDYVTVKYDVEGNELWVRRYDHGLDDQASALAVDGAGDLYVTGYSHDDVTGFDYATVKYDADGNELWVRRYDHWLDDRSSALVVDRTGNVYVTGSSHDAVTGFDYATVKYDAEGTELWVRRFDYDLSDYAQAVAVDGAGNVYVTGTSDDAVTGGDYATVKYDPEGNELWIVRYHYGISDIPEALAVDVAGSVYVTGNSSYSLTESDIATVKYVQTLEPEEMMANAIAFYEEALETGTIYGLGQGNAAPAHERLFGQMLDAVYDLIVAEHDDQACRKLSKVLQRVEGDQPPPDLVGGRSAPSLYEALLAVYEELDCQTGTAK